jgi:hypothetical protein
MRRFLLPSLAGMSGEGMVEGLPVNLLRVFGQMRADGGREIGIGWIGIGSSTKLASITPPVIGYI